MTFSLTLILSQRLLLEPPFYSFLSKVEMNHNIAREARFLPFSLGVAGNCFMQYRRWAIFYEGHEL